MRVDNRNLALINQALEDLNEVARLLSMGDAAEAEYWVERLRHQWAARAYEHVTGRLLPTGIQTTINQKGGTDENA